MKKNNENISAVTENVVRPKGRKLRFGAYSLMMTALFVAALIILNIFASYLTTNYPLNLDFTADKKFTISETNKKYIKDVEKEIEIIVCAKESEYSGYMAQIMEMQGVSDSSGGEYFSQALALLKEYEKLNKNINIKFRNALDPEFTDITSKYSNEALQYGDFIISRDMGGDNAPRYKRLAYTDLYSITQDTTGYGYSTLDGSSVEIAVTGAIYSVTADKTYNVSYLTGHGEGDIANLKAVLSPYNYEFTQVGVLTINEIPEDTDIIVIIQPNSDYSASELKKISDFLQDNDKSDRGLMFFANRENGETENLWEFLKEWGIELVDSTVYETDEAYTSSFGNYTIFAQSNGTDYTKALDNNKNELYLLGENNQVMKNMGLKGERVSESVVGFEQSTVEKPRDAASDWNPADASGESILDMITVTRQTTYDGTDPKQSYVAAFSTIDLVNPQWVGYKDIGNDEAILGIADIFVGAEQQDLDIVQKTISSVTFSETVKENSVKFIKIIFLGVIPLTIAALGFIIWFRRKNK